jgi:hypothetical protein
LASLLALVGPAFSSSCMALMPDGRLFLGGMLGSGGEAKARGRNIRLVAWIECKHGIEVAELRTEKGSLLLVVCYRIGDPSGNNGVVTTSRWRGEVWATRQV